MFNLGIDNEWVQKNLFKSETEFKLDPVRRKILAPTSQPNLDAATPKYFKPVITTALNSGLRRYNLRTLKWSYIGLEFRTIEITKNNGKKHIKLPILWDFEYDSVNRANGKGVHVTKESCSSMADNFCKTIEKLGFKSGIYTNIDYSRRYFTQEVLDKYYTWIAQWTSECTYKGKYILWQKSANLRIGGIVFDLNYLYYNRYEGDINEEDS